MYLNRTTLQVAAPEINAQHSSYQTGCKDTSHAAANCNVSQTARDLIDTYPELLLELSEPQADQNIQANTEMQNALDHLAAVKKTQNEMNHMLAEAIEEATLAEKSYQEAKAECDQALLYYEQARLTYRERKQVSEYMGEHQEFNQAADAYSRAQEELHEASVKKDRANAMLLEKKIQCSQALDDVEKAGHLPKSLLNLLLIPGIQNLAEYLFGFSATVSM